MTNQILSAERAADGRFIVITGDRFEAAQEIKDLYADQSPTGYPFVTLEEQPSGFAEDES
jgi:hypothetical protein